MVASDGMSMQNFQGSDAFYSGAYSYNAGVGEEAMFRGWLMPVFHQKFDSPFWANATTSVLFAQSSQGQWTKWKCLKKQVLSPTKQNQP